MTAGDIIVVAENAFGRKGNYYDGTDDYVLHDNHAVARNTANDTVGTYTAWIYLDSVPQTATILSCGDNNATGEFIQFFMDSGGRLRVILEHGSAEQFDVRQTTANINAREWTHVAVVQNGIRPTLYVNGKAVAMTDETSTDLTDWYLKLTLVDKFAIGVLETNNTHLFDFKGAIGRVKYFNMALNADEILIEFKEGTHTKRATAIETARVFDITYENDGITDSGSGADDGTLTGGAIYGGEISDWSYKINANVTGHAAEFINTLDLKNGKFLTLIKRGD